MEKYEVIKALGQGTWGVVHMARQKSTGRFVALKKIKSERPEEGINFTAIREIKLLREFKHPNVIEREYSDATYVRRHSFEWIVQVLNCRGSCRSSPASARNDSTSSHT
jgi:serine/threonine protein kinase